MDLPICVRSGAATVLTLSCVAACSGGVVVDSGSIPLWGHATPFTSWDVFQDPAPGILGPTEGRPRGLEFHHGRLHMAISAYTIDGAPTYYTPGPGGDLSTPTTPRITNVLPPDGRRFYQIRGLTVNASGAGYGGFTGPDATLVTFGSDSVERRLSTLVPDQVNYTLGALTRTPPTSPLPWAIEYVPSLDQFLVLSGDANPAVTNFDFHSHSAAGLGPHASSFTGSGGIRAAQTVSASFASMLIGQPVSQESLLCLEAGLLGISQPPRLVLYSLAGALLSSTDLLLPGYQDYPTEGLDPVSLAVDESSALLFVGDRGQARIHVLTVPSPTAAASVCFGALLAMRRRRRSVV